MAKAKKNSKVQMPGSIKTRLTAAFCMLMVSFIMMVSATYAWFTLSTAPEVKNITTSAAGNGSLEIALMPNNGLFTAIGKSMNSSKTQGGKADVTIANTTWGNIVELGDSSYGLENVTLLPASLTVPENNGAPSLKIASYGKDGRVTTVDTVTTVFAAWQAGTAAEGETPATEAGFQTIGTENKMGVRAIGTETTKGSGETAETKFDTYAYAVDLAFRSNEPGKLKLLTEATQRINGSSNTETMGAGSTMTIGFSDDNLSNEKLVNLMQAIRVTFIQNYGNAESGVTTQVLGTARLEPVDVTGEGAKVTTGNLYLYKETTTVEGEGAATTATKDTTGVLLDSLEKNAAVQITAIVWLDGAALTNADVGINGTSFNATLNLQFGTDATLTPAKNTSLYGTADAAQGGN